MFDRHNLDSNVFSFLAARHFASLTTIRPDGGLHAALVGFVYDQKTARATLILRGRGVKFANLQVAGDDAEVVLCQVAGGSWVTLEGTITLDNSDEARSAALEKYRLRYGETVGDDPTRYAAMIAVRRMYGFVLPT